MNTGGVNVSPPSATDSRYQKTEMHSGANTGGLRLGLRVKGDRVKGLRLGLSVKGYRVKGEPLKP